MVEKEENYAWCKLLIIYSGIDGVEKKRKSGDELFFYYENILSFV